MGLVPLFPHDAHHLIITMEEHSQKHFVAYAKGMVKEMENLRDVVVRQVNLIVTASNSFIKRIEEEVQSS